MIIDVHTHNANAGNAIINLRVNGDTTEPARGFFSVGIHPWDVTPHINSSLYMVRHLASLQQVVAIGETGLDSLRNRDNLDYQEMMLQEHIIIANEVNKPLILHVVRAWQNVIKTCRTTKPTVPCVIHGFRGNENVAQLMLNDGFYLSLGENFNSKAAILMPSERLLIETDESRLSISDIASRIAQVRSTTVDHILHIAQANARRVFGI